MKNEIEEAKGESARADEELKQVPGLRRGGWGSGGIDVLLADVVSQCKVEM